jgi:hypothetical protein
MLTLPEVVSNFIGGDAIKPERKRNIAPVELPQVF